MTALGTGIDEAGTPDSPLLAEAAGGKRAELLTAEGRRAARPLKVFATVLTTLVLAALLNADHLVDRAGKKPFGGDRDFWLAVWEPFEDFSDAVYLNRPRQWLDVAVDREITDSTFEFTSSPIPVPPPDIVHTAPPPTAEPGGVSAAIADSGPVAPEVPSDLFGHPAPPPLVRTAAADHPLKLFVAGDSMAVAFGSSLSRMASATGLITPDMDARASSGLTRPDFFDWPARLASIVEDDQPDVVVVMFGANDSQGIRSPDGHVYQPLTDGWREEYRRRVAGTMDLLTAPGRLVIWVGQPVMSTEGFSERMADQDAIYRAEAALRHGVLYFDSWPLFVDASGKYDTFLPDESGQVQEMRTGDGIHLTRAGGDRLAKAVLAALDQVTPVLPAH